eukprot:919862-Rhodomonas_salina.1
MRLKEKGGRDEDRGSENAPKSGRFGTTFVPLGLPPNSPHCADPSAASLPHALRDPSWQRPFAHAACRGCCRCCVFALPSALLCGPSWASGEIPAPHSSQVPAT